MTEREVVQLVKEWKDEMKGVVADYNSMLQKLDKAVTQVEASEKKFWVVHKKPITVGIVLLSVLVFVVGVTMTMKFTNTCIVNVNPKAQAVFNSCEGLNNEQKAIQKAD